MHRLATALMALPKPLVCMNTAALRPAAYEPTAIPTASSSLVADTRWKKGSSLMILVTRWMDESGT